MRNWTGRNERWIKKHHRTPVEILSDHPARRWLLVGAAPSLERNYARIVELRSCGWSLALCDMGFIPFIVRGIVPDILFTCEPRAYPFFSLNNKTLPDLSLMSVAAPSSVHPAQLQALHSIGVENFIFYQWEKEPEKIPGLPVLPEGGNVFNAMLVFFGGLKGGKLQFFGNDYTFTGKGIYIRGNAHALTLHTQQNRWETPETYLQNIIRNSKTVSSGVYTTESFITYRQWQQKYLTLLNNSGHIHVME